MERRIRAVFFDLDDTLHDFGGREPLPAALRRTCQRFASLAASASADRLIEAYLKCYEEFWSHPFAGPLWAEANAEIWSRTLAACGCREVTTSAISQAFMKERLRSFHLFEDTIGVLDQPSGYYTLGVITNGQSDMQRAKLAALGLEHYFQVVAISAEVGVSKPAIGIFVEAARRAEASPDESVHVGDSLVLDVAGAKSAGMTGVWLNRNGLSLAADEVQQDETVTSLMEVPALLSKWLRGYD